MTSFEAAFQNTLQTLEDCVREEQAQFDLVKGLDPETSLLQTLHILVSGQNRGILESLTLRKFCNMVLSPEPDMKKILEGSRKRLQVMGIVSNYLSEKDNATLQQISEELVNRGIPVSIDFLHSLLFRMKENGGLQKKGDSWSLPKVKENQNAGKILAAFGKNKKLSWEEISQKTHMGRFQLQSGLKYLTDEKILVRVREKRKVYFLLNCGK